MRPLLLSFPPERKANFFFRMGNITDASILFQVIFTARAAALRVPGRAGRTRGGVGSRPLRPGCGGRPQPPRSSSPPRRGLRPLPRRQGNGGQGPPTRLRPRLGARLRGTQTSASLPPSEPPRQLRGIRPGRETATRSPTPPGDNARPPPR